MTGRPVITRHLLSRLAGELAVPVQDIGTSDEAGDLLDAFVLAGGSHLTKGVKWARLVAGVSSVI